MVAKKQLQSSSAFLKIRKRDWTEQGASLKAIINTKLSVFRAAALVQVKSFASVDSDGKSSKRLLLETLALFIDAAEACLYFVWRKLRITEELFSLLLNGISQIAVTRGGQLLRVWRIRLKPLVLTTCDEADTWGNSQGAMFESVTKTVYSTMGTLDYVRPEGPLKKDYSDVPGHERQGLNGMSTHCDEGDNAKKCLFL